MKIKKKKISLIYSVKKIKIKIETLSLRHVKTFSAE